MSVVNPKCSVDGSHLNIVWERSGRSPYAICVQIAKNIELTNTIRTFVIPDGLGISIDAGNGVWFYRVGSWYGTPQTGTVTWTSVYGPALVANPKLCVGVRPSSIGILHTQAIEKGLRIHTGCTTAYYVMADVCKDNTTIGASVSSTQYAYDKGNGYVDIIGLDYAHTYSIRIATFADDPSKLPIDSIKQLSAGLVLLSKRPARQLRKLESSVATAARADATLLKDIARQPKLSFPSHAEYLKYVSAKAKTSEEVRPNRVGPQ
jgi:hypothetical protein